MTHVKWVLAAVAVLAGLPARATGYLQPESLASYQRRWGRGPSLYEPLRPGVIKVRWWVRKRPTTIASLYINEETLEVVGEDLLSFESDDKLRDYVPQWDLWLHRNDRGVKHQKVPLRMAGHSMVAMMEEVFRFPDGTEASLSGNNLYFKVLYPTYRKALKPTGWTPAVLPEARLRALSAELAEPAPSDPDPDP